MVKMRNLHYQIASLYLTHPHDDAEMLRAALAERGIDKIAVQLPVDLDQIDTMPWHEYDMVIIRNCRGYHLAADNFLKRLQRLNDVLRNTFGDESRMQNPFDIVQASIDKGRFLQQLARVGISTVPTRYVTIGEHVTLRRIMDEEGWDDVVIKPAIASRSYEAHRIRRELHVPHTWQYQAWNAEAANLRELPEDLYSRLLRTHKRICVQKFYNSILDQGELSFVFIGGRYSHAVEKRVGNDPDAWIAHEYYGGTNVPYSPSLHQIYWAEKVYEDFSQEHSPLLYGRIDALHDHQQLLLLECELFVPRLFLTEGHAIETYANAIQQLLYRQVNTGERPPIRRRRP
jgi:glutathione synthase/RimK-type ligase-like ATP-grasp enzyme